MLVLRSLVVLRYACSSCWIGIEAVSKVIPRSSFAAIEGRDPLISLNLAVWCKPSMSFGILRSNLPRQEAHRHPFQAYLQRDLFATAYSTLTRKSLGALSVESPSSNALQSIASSPTPPCLRPDVLSDSCNRMYRRKSDLCCVASSALEGRKFMVSRWHLSCGSLGTKNGKDVAEPVCWHFVAVSWSKYDRAARRQ